MKHLASGFVTTRREAVVSAAKDAGLMSGVNIQLGARAPEQLVRSAKEKSGLSSTTELLEYALAKVALEDDYGPKLLARKGRVAKDLEL
jgi:hypothetical protein